MFCIHLREGRAIMKNLQPFILRESTKDSFTFGGKQLKIHFRALTFEKLKLSAPSSG